MRPFAGARAFTGPIGVSNGSERPKVVASVRLRSRLAGFSFATANFTASSRRTASIPTSDGFLGCHSKRSGKYGAAVGATAGRGAGDGRGVCPLVTTDNARHAAANTAAVEIWRILTCFLGGLLSLQMRHILLVFQTGVLQ